MTQNDLGLCSYKLRRGRDALVLTLPIRTVSESNRRDHWSVKHRDRTRPQRTVVGLALRQHAKALGLPVRVLLSRLSPGTLDDDNLRSALKAVRDGVADAIGVNDADPRVAWHYEQRLVARGLFGIEVAITRAV